MASGGNSNSENLSRGEYSSKLLCKTCSGTGSWCNLKNWRGYFVFFFFLILWDGKEEDLILLLSSWNSPVFIKSYNCLTIRFGSDLVGRLLFQAPRNQNSTWRGQAVIPPLSSPIPPITIQQTTASTSLLPQESALHFLKHGESGYYTLYLCHWHKSIIRLSTCGHFPNTSKQLCQLLA